MRNFFFLIYKLLESKSNFKKNILFRLNEKKLKENADQISPLQSWGPEVRNFRKLPKKPIVEGDCEVVIEKPTYILKIDAGIKSISYTISNKNFFSFFFLIIYNFKKCEIIFCFSAVNMYHHFCDFFNLYASLHVNLSHPSAFSTDNHIMIWESYRYDLVFLSLN